MICYGLQANPLSCPHLLPSLHMPYNLILFGRRFVHHTVLPLKNNRAEQRYSSYHSVVITDAAGSHGSMYTHACRVCLIRSSMQMQRTQVAAGWPSWHALFLLQVLAWQQAMHGSRRCMATGLSRFPIRSADYSPSAPGQQRSCQAPSCGTPRALGLFGQPCNALQTCL